MISFIYGTVVDSTETSVIVEAGGSAMRFL